MVQPSQLLKDLRVVGVTVKDPAVSALCSLELSHVSAMKQLLCLGDTNLLLLFVNMSNLEPDVLFRQWARGVGNNVFEALPEG